jgi:hypothetical protein
MVARTSEGGVTLAHMREMINEHKILVGKSGQKRPLVRPKLRWDDINIMSTGFRVQRRALVNMVMNIRVP